jgi:hypothetical protein
MDLLRVGKRVNLCSFYGLRPLTLKIARFPPAQAKYGVIYGPTRFASDLEALINKFIAFIYPACEPGVLYTRSPNAIS